MLPAQWGMKCCWLDHNTAAQQAAVAIRTQGNLAAAGLQTSENQHALKTGSSQAIKAKLLQAA